MRRVWLGIFLTLLTFAPTVLAQDVSESTVTAVRIEGLELVSEQVVRARLEVQVGQVFSLRAVSRDTRRLFELGHFTNVRVDRSEAEGGVAITYIVEEKQIIDDIKIIGNDKIKSTKIRAELTLRVGDAFVPEAYEQEREAIMALYQGKGFANTVVDITAARVGPSRIRMVYDISEGSKARINKISFLGNGAIDTKSLKKTMKTKRKKWIIGGKFDEAKLDADLDSIISEYGNIGRLEAEIAKTDLVFTPNGKGMALSIYLSEGPEYSIDTLEIGNNIVFDENELLALLGVGAGDIHNRGQIATDRTAIQNQYRSSGYINAAVSVQETLNREEKTTEVVHRISEGSLKYVRQLNISGNDTTKDEVIRRELSVVPSERFDGGAVSESARRLANTGFYETARIDPDPIEDEEGVESGDSDLYTDMRVDVVEADTGTLNFGVGFSPTTRFGGFGELRLNNFDATNWPTFRGGGQQLSLRMDISDLADQVRLSFTDPEFLGTPILFGFDVFQEAFRFIGGSNFQQDSAGAQLRVGKVLSPYVTVGGSFLFQVTDLSNLPETNVRELLEQEGENTTISTRWQIERNTIDRILNPSTGSHHTLSTRLAGLADFNFVKFEHDSAWFWPLVKSKKWVLSFRMREGWSSTYGDSTFIPLQDKFYAGGATTVRGFDDREIGPQIREVDGRRFSIGGRMRFVTNTELKYRANDLLSIFTFFDSGGVWADESDIDPADIKYSVGLGVGVTVPLMGPMRIDYGFTLNPDGHQRSGRLHLNTGLRF